MSTITLNGFSQKSCVITAYFEASPLQICTGDSVLFENKTGAYFNDTLAFKWDYDGGALNDSISGQLSSGCFSNGIPFPTPCQSFYKQFNTVGIYNVQLFVYKLNTDTGLYIPADTFSRTITVVDSTAWGFINTLTNFECNTPFWVTDSSFNLLPTQNFMGGVTSIYWTLYDYNLGVSNTHYSQIGDTLNIQTFGTNGLIDLPIGQYWLKMETQSYCNASIVDSINFFITSGTPEISGTQFMCLGDTAMFVGESGCPDFWQWNFGDGSTFSGNDTAFHQFSQVGIYQVSLQTNNGGDTGYFNVEIVQAQSPIIKGYQNNCDSVVLYSIENFDTNYTYTWSTQIFDATTNQYSNGNFIINGNTNVETANTASINWNSAVFPPLPKYVVITLEATLKGSNCSSISTLKVYECCENDMGQDGLYWHDTTITDAHILNNKYIAINGTVILKDSLVMNQAGIWFGADSKIVLDTGGYFELKDGDLRAGCEYMWDGIYVNSPSESVKITGSSLSDAVNGIVSENGGAMVLDTVYFNNNYISVQLLNYRSATFPIPPPTFSSANISITNCDFNNEYTPYINLPYYPYYNKQSKIGILVSNMEDIRIGDTILGGNTFYKLQTGIKVYNSKLGVYNNYFKNIMNYLYSASNNEAAISINSHSVFDMGNIGDVKIGASGTFHNEFDSCYKSIYSNNSKLLVQNNVFKYGHQSLDIYNFMNDSKLLNNLFKDAYFGIRVQSLLGVPRKLQIKDNYFEGVSSNYSQITREGINVINCNSQPNSSVKTQITNNTINYSGQRNNITCGIRIQNCDGIKLNSNHIARLPGNLTVINADWTYTIGIRVATCQAAEITDNYVWGFGQSIHTYGNNNTTQFSCNELKVYHSGFNWGAFTSLTNQGIDSLRNTHNEWHSVGSIFDNMKLDTASAPNIVSNYMIKWYYNPVYNQNYGSQFVPNMVMNGSQIRIQATPNNPSATHQCVGGSGGGGNGGSGTGTGGGSSSGGGVAVQNLIDNINDPELRDFMFEDLMQGEEYHELENEYRAYDADFLYEMLAADTNMMWLGGEKDADYRHFFDSIRQSNIGDFQEVYDLIDAGSYTEARALNNSIIPEQDIFSNMKAVLGIYLNSWCAERYSLSQSEYDSLFFIANQTPYEGGDGVYTARIMIGFEPDEHGIAYRMQKQDEQKDKRKELILYPNPASDKVTIEFINDKFNNVSAELQVFSITGKLIYSTNFTTNASFKVLPVDMLKNGLYIYHISLSNGIDKSGKLVILKQ